jgi:hypothetical protein
MLACAEEFNGFSRTLAKRWVKKVYDTTKQVLALAADEGIPAGDRLAERLIAPGEPIVTDPVWNTRGAARRGPLEWKSRYVGP